MKVFELREALKGIPGSIEVTIYIPENCRPGMPNYMRRVQGARDMPAGPINNREFEITAGAFFGY